MTGTAEPTPAHILEIGFAFRKSKALLSAVELGVFAALAERPRSCEDLAGQVGIHARGARDFFDALAALGLLERATDGRYSNAAACAAFLDPAKPSYIGGLLEYLDASVYPTWAELSRALRDGKPVAGPAAAGGFERFYGDPRSLRVFLDGMSGGSREPARALAERFDWTRHATVIDIGTAEGCVPVEIARAHPHLRGGGFDLPMLRAAFEAHVRRSGLDGRLQFHSGDFFADPLPSADVLVMGRVLHDWDIATRRMLLSKAHDALPAGGTLIVHETFIEEGRRGGAHNLLASLNMLLQTEGGAEFTVAECIGWLDDAGFGGMQVVPLSGPQSAVIAVKPARCLTGVHATTTRSPRRRRRGARTER